MRGIVFINNRVSVDMKGKNKAGKDDLARRIIRLICGIAAAASLGYFAYYCYESSGASDKAEKLSVVKDNAVVNEMIPPTVHLDEKQEAPPMLDEFNALYLKNRSIVGWIKVEGTQIDYPVMQSSNEEYYLDHNFEQEKDSNGSIFIDSACSIWPRSQNIIIYGHNMKSGKMFGGLDKYKDKGYCDKHPVISFDTLYEKGEYQVMYVFNEVIHEETEVAFKYYQFIDANSAQEYESDMEAMSEMSLYDTGVVSFYGDSLITLSTCDYSKGAERFVVVAKKID
ncbi:MAG: class B sortase [Lachnospiraceae bacterium]|nr:class B sortase [Lachnospiraceae bacterium]